MFLICKINQSCIVLCYDSFLTTRWCQIQIYISIIYCITDLCELLQDVDTISKTLVKLITVTTTVKLVKLILYDYVYQHVCDISSLIGGCEHSHKHPDIKKTKSNIIGFTEAAILNQISVLVNTLTGHFTLGTLVQSNVIQCNNSTIKVYFYKAYNVLVFVDTVREVLILLVLVGVDVVQDRIILKGISNIMALLCIKVY